MTTQLRSERAFSGRRAPARAPRRGVHVAIATLLLWSGVGACARQGTLTGGPQDRRPPVLVAVQPDTFARVEPGDDRIRIIFDETLSEQVQGGTMNDVVLVSPRTGEVEVKHSGNELEVRVEGGFVAGAVYRVTVLPKLTDRFSNTLLAPFEWVFTTGPDFERNALAGELWDRVTGDPIVGAEVVALSEDSVAYVAVTDSAGIFAMRYLPTGRYELSGLVDRDRDRTVDPFEPQGRGDDLVIGAADTLLTSFALLVPDTTPPRLALGEKIDSTRVRVTFDDPLDPSQALDRFVRGVYRDSGDTPAVLRVLHEWEYEAWQDSVSATAEAAGEEAAGAEPLPDSAAARVDSLEIGPGGQVLGPGGRPVDPGAQGGAPGGVESDAAGGDGPRGGPGRGAEKREFLPNGERVPSTTLVLFFRDVIEGGATYTVAHGPIRNISGLVTDQGEGQIRLARDPEPPPADSILPDSILPDSVLPDSIRPDSIAPDTTLPDTAVADTTLPDTTLPVAMVSAPARFEMRRSGAWLPSWLQGWLPEP